MQKSPTCPVCLFDQDVRWLLDKNGCRLHRCSACDHIFVDPHPTAERIASLYSFDSGYQVQAMQRFDTMDDFPPKVIRSLDQIKKRVPSGRLLDVGCSIGIFLYLACKAGFDAEGVELNPDTAKIARANGLEVFVGTLDAAGLEPASFDVIHLGDLIEHVPDPEQILRSVCRLLRPGGTLLVLTPNHDAFFPRTTYRLSRTLGIPWSHPTPPLHLNQFSRKSLLQLMQRAGLSVEEEHYAPCSLVYEMRATGVYGPLKRLIGERRFFRALPRAFYGVIVGCFYTIVWTIDRLLPGKSTDFAMTLLAVPTPAPGAMTD